MIRTVAGVFEPGGLTSRTAQRRRVERAVGPARAAVLEFGSLVVGFTGSPPEQDPRATCLVDGGISWAGDGDPGLAATPLNEQLVVRYDRRHRLDSLVTEMRGEFVVILWRRSVDELVLIRDHFGARPLFLFREGPRLLFASEVRDLLQMLRRVPDPDDRAVANWLQTGLLPAETTFYQGITPLRPAHLMEVSDRGTRERRYWDPVYQPRRRLSREDVDDLIRIGIERAITRRIPPEGPIGVMLGGGIDASTVAAFTRRLTGPEREIKAYSAVFPDHPTVDESHFIDTTTCALGMAKTQLRVARGSLLTGAMDFIRDWRLPVGPPTHGFMRELVARSADDGMAVLLDGEGGDETFGASPYMIGNHLRRGRVDLVWQVARRPSGTGLYLNPSQMLRFLWRYGLRPARRARHSSAAELDRTWLLPGSAELLDEALSASAWTRRSGPFWWRWLSWTLVDSRELAGAHDFFRRQAAGEIPRRHPFLDDVDLIELVLSLPPETAHHPEMNRPALRRLTIGVLPDEVRVRREKTVWNETLDAAVTGADGTPIADVLLDGQAEIRRFVDTSRLAGPLTDRRHRRHGTRSGWSQELWRLAVMEVWLRSLGDSNYLSTGSARLGLHDGAHAIAADL